MLIDDVTIKVTAGNGGRGAVAFDKNKMALGPAGGSGGNGGSVYFEGVSNLSALNQFRYKKDIAAENGQEGRSQFRDGKDGGDLILKVPVGTVIHNLDTHISKELVKIGEKILVAKGGNGGKGNFLFRSPHNTSPKRFQFGLQGEHAALRLELKLIADVGLIGLPNVGKSSLLNALTSAKSKVANYPFTTLEPNLGVYYDLILADIPGLIEGASAGKGLGMKFLRHIERTNTLFHLISAESENPVKDYQTIRKELENYNPSLTQKKEYVFVNKSDLASSKKLAKITDAFAKMGIKATPISVMNKKNIDDVKILLNQIAEAKRVIPTLEN